MFNSLREKEFLIFVKQIIGNNYIAAKRGLCAIIQRTRQTIKEVKHEKASLYFIIGYNGAYSGICLLGR